jgi:4-hydroxy-2-oxoheptanedioate aldolase
VSALCLYCIHLHANVQSGIVVPQVNTADEARAVVSDAKFPPQGRRGQGSAFPGIAHGIDIPTYMKAANETLITCLQIETKTGVENIDAICAVPGVGKYSHFRQWIR